MANNIVHARQILPHVIDKLGSSQVCNNQSRTEFHLIVQLDVLSSLQADALGLHGVAALYMHVNLPSAMYYGGGYQPVVEIKAHTNSTKYSDSPYAAILAQINKISEAFFADNWPCKTQLDTLEFLPKLYHHIQARVPLLGSLCVVCGKKQGQTGLKPLPCTSKACTDAFNEQGIGADVRDIYSRPVIADLLITMASASCQYTCMRHFLFQKMPRNIFQTIQSHSAQDSQQIDWQRMQEAFKSFPSVAAMAGEPNLQEFFIKMDSKAGLPRIQFLRWILNSCQGHLMQLQGEDKFPGMATEYQFRLCTDSPSKEATFSQLKEMHGSQYFFHGSSFYNWHSILREGLKDMTRIGSASNGVCYSAGIYLAKSSAVSAGYCHYRQNSAIPAYADSRFGKSPRCLALCEVINDYSTSTSTQNSDVRVEMDAGKVIARYLFVFQGIQSNEITPGSTVVVAVPTIPTVRAASLSEICEKHAKQQASTLEAVKKASQDL